MMEKYIMAIDAGTTSSRCIIYDKKGQIISVGQKAFEQFFPKPGWVEHDPLEIWATQAGVCREALEKAGLSAANIDSIGITNQRETTVVWNRKTGKPVYNAIVWQCRRTASYADELKARGLEDTIRKKTGLPIDPYFSGTKLKWILDNVEGARELAEAGDLLFGTIDTWLIWKLTGGKIHVTDYSNASRTMMFNIISLNWDDDILRMLDIPRKMLPDVKPSSYIYGYADEKIFGRAIPISGAAGDQQCALFGQNCFNEGEAKNTYGTGCFLLMNTGDSPVFSNNGLVTTIAWGLKGRVNYALEGSVYIAGAAIKWLREEMGLIESAKKVKEICESVEDTNGVVVVPAFTGLGAPYWDSYARGAVFGLSRGANDKHFVRAVAESLAYQADDLIQAMNQDAGKPLETLQVDGGASQNDFLMQFQADITGCPVKRPVSVETTSLGAAYLAGLATGYYRSLEDIRENWQVDRVFTPDMDEETRKAKIKEWKRAVRCVLEWSRDN